MPLRRLLVAIDSAEKEHHALELALALCRQYGSELLICTAIDHAAVMAEASTPDVVYPSVSLVLDEYDTAAKALLQASAARAAAAGIEATTMLLDGRPAGAIVTCATESEVDAIVVATLGKSGLERAFAGSTAEGILELTELPTFVLHVPDEAGGTPYSDAGTIRRILVALDDSDPASAALGFAAELASASLAALLCCTVIETDDLFAKARAYGYDPQPILAELRAEATALLLRKMEALPGGASSGESFALEGKLPDAIYAAAAAREIDLIAIGTHGRRGIKRLFLGSVAARLVRRSDVPVVVVHAPHERVAEPPR